MTGSALSLFVIDRSARVMTVVPAVPLLLAGVGSVVVELTVAVFETSAVRLGATFTTKLDAPVAPAARVVIEHLTGGAVQVKVGPVVWLSETELVPAATASARQTAWASDGPPLATVIV